jgi:hypothetical protein
LAIEEKGGTMEQKIEREWKSIVCPEGKKRTSIMCEWDIVSGAGHIFRRTLKQIYCQNPKLAEFGGTDCDWECEKIIAKVEKRDI